VSSEINILSHAISTTMSTIHSIPMFPIPFSDDSFINHSFDAFHYHCMIFQYSILLFMYILTKYYSVFILTHIYSMSNHRISQYQWLMLNHFYSMSIHFSIHSHWPDYSIFSHPYHLKYSIFNAISIMCINSISLSSQYSSSSSQLKKSFDHSSMSSIRYIPRCPALLRSLPTYSFLPFDKFHFS